MDSRSRIARTALAALVGFFALIMVALQLHLADEPRAASGARIVAQSGLVASVRADSPAAAAGLAAGDRVALNRLSLRDRIELAGGVAEHAHRMELTFTRGATVSTTHLAIVSSVAADANVVPAAVRTVGFALVLGVAAVLIGANGTLAAAAFFGFALACAPMAASLLVSTALPDPVVRAAAFLDAWSTAGGFLLALFLARIGAPRDLRFREQAVLLGVTVAGVGLALVQGAFYEHLTGAWFAMPREVGYLVAAYALIRRLFTTRREELERMRWIGAASLTVFAAQVAIAAKTDFGRILGLDPLASAHLVAAASEIIVVFPVVVAFAVLTPNLEDLPDRVIGHSTRVVLAAALGLGLVALCAVTATLANLPALAIPLDLTVAVTLAYTLRYLTDAYEERRASGAAM